MHGARGLKIEFGVEGGPRAAETWVRSIQLALLAFQHQAKRKYLKTSTFSSPAKSAASSDLLLSLALRRSVKHPAESPSNSPRAHSGGHAPVSPTANRTPVSGIFQST